jgi:hypothetical protein
MAWTSTTNAPYNFDFHAVDGLRLRGCFGLGRALLFALFCFRLDLGLRGGFSLSDSFLAVFVLQTLYILRVDGARRVREALLLRRDLSRVIRGVEGALLGRRFFTGGRRRWLHDETVSWREEDFGL